MLHARPGTPHPSPHPSQQPTLLEHTLVYAPGSPNSTTRLPLIRSSRCTVRGSGASSSSTCGIISGAQGASTQHERVVGVQQVRVWLPTMHPVGAMQRAAAPGKERVTGEHAQCARAAREMHLFARAGVSPPLRKRVTCQKFPLGYLVALVDGGCLLDVLGGHRLSPCTYRAAGPRTRVLQVPAASGGRRKPRLEVARATAQPPTR
jgi:hypothetical protein